MSKWSDVLAEVRNAASDQEALAAFVRACARAFAGTDFVPTKFKIWSLNSLLQHTIHLELNVRNLMDLRSMEDMVPRPAGIRDPRFCLRGPRPKRGRYATRPPLSRRYLRGLTI